LARILKTHKLFLSFGIILCRKPGVNGWITGTTGSCTLAVGVALAVAVAMGVAVDGDVTVAVLIIVTVAVGIWVGIGITVAIGTTFTRMVLCGLDLRCCLFTTDGLARCFFSIFTGARSTAGGFHVSRVMTG
jgi:hypothetical protein